MKVSHYTKAYPYGDGHLLLYSLLTTAVALVEEETWQRAENGVLSEEERETLAGQGFLVPDTEEEKNSASTLLERSNAANTVVGLVPVMNLDCNLSCVYCFEGGMKGRLYMDEATADALMDFAAAQLTPDKETLRMTFYGGEPLLSLGLIKYIAQKARALAGEKGAEYRFSLVTNGTLLTRKAVEELAPLGLESAKVTLDGPRESHDRHRPFKGGKGSFDTIVRNLKDVCERIRITVGGNFTRENHRLFPELLDFLAAEGLTPDRIASVKFDPVTPPEHRSPTADFSDGCMSINEPWLIRASLWLREEILRRGYDTPQMNLSSCVLNNKSHFVVNFDGGLYKCPGFIGRRGFQAGDLAGGASDYRASHALDSWRNRECLECQYLPFCFGGCKYMKCLRDGNVEGIDCKKQYLEETLETFIKQDVQYRFGPDGE